MLNIIDVNDEVFKFLMHQRSQTRRSNELQFTLRKSNAGGRMAAGHWFNGNLDYMAVSFWSGMDWKNRTPNIILVIKYDGNTYLEITASDSNEKLGFVEENLVKRLDLQRTGNKYFKHYDSHHEQKYIERLQNFLWRDKGEIDQSDSRIWDMTI